MTEKIDRALALCAKTDGTDRVMLKPGAEKRNCEQCGVEIWVAPTTLAIPAETIILACNPCGRALAAGQVLRGEKPPELRIAPGALKDQTPDDRRRRNELEAHGFSDL